MESVWYVFKQIWDKKLVYRGCKVMPYSNACNTVLSNFETHLNYKDTQDPSVFITFPLVSDPNTKLVAWTTTPWTLPSNLALAVNPNFTYVYVIEKKTNSTLIIAECRLEEFLAKAEGGKDGFQVIAKKSLGSELVGLEYVALFEYFADRRKDGCFRVLSGDFVTADAGTGIVHW
jgi:isoleucyl-tRNA synthetase